ncbi:hypothetical protein [Janibacter terrae]|uniref:hypothetical protein n=1 Tax=Janibacter terrae TaxID=103817 RepID=UPI0031F8191D
MRVKDETFGAGNQSWLGSNHGTDNARTSTFVTANFTAGTHYPDGHVPSGLAVNCADEANLKPWTDAAGEVLGFVLFNQPVDGQAKFAVPVIRHGLIRRANLPVAITTATGSTGSFTFVGSDA